MGNLEDSLNRMINTDSLLELNEEYQKLCNKIAEIYSENIKRLEKPKPKISIKDALIYVKSYLDMNLATCDEYDFDLEDAMRVIVNAYEAK